MQALPDVLRRLARQQSGALRCSQLDAYGFRSRDVTRRIDAGLWQRATSRVIVVHSGNVDRRAWLWIASLHHERVGLTGAAALELEGMPPARTGRIDLLGPRGSRQSPFPGCVLTTVPDPVFAPGPGPLRTPAALSVAYAMAHAASARQAVFHVVWPLQRRIVTIKQVRAAISRQPQSATMAAARRTLDLVDPGVQSMHEYDFARECRRRGLPAPVRQTPRRDGRGGRRYTDAEFHVRGKVLVVEIDGSGHLDPDVWLDDQWRANEFTMQGNQVLRIPGLALRTDPEPFFDQIRRALA